MQQINLIEAGLVPVPPRLTATLTAAVLGLAAALVAGHALVEVQRGRNLAAALASASGVGDSSTAAGQGGAAATAPAADAALQAELARRESLKAVLAQQSTQGPAMAQTVAHLVQALPAEVWLTELDLAGPQGLRLAGGALDAGALAVLAQRLSQQPALRGVALDVLRLQAVVVESPAEGPVAPTTVAGATTDSNADSKADGAAAEQASAAAADSADATPSAAGERALPPHHRFVLASTAAQVRP